MGISINQLWRNIQMDKREQKIFIENVVMLSEASGEPLADSRAEIYFSRSSPSSGSGLRASPKPTPIAPMKP